MHKLIKSFGRELAFLLVLVFVMSSGGLFTVYAAYTASNDAANRAKTYLSTQTITINYLEKGYTITQAKATITKAVQAKLNAANYTATVTLVTTARVDTVTGIYNMGLYHNGKTTGTSVDVSVRVGDPTPLNVVNEAKAYLSMNNTVLLTSTGVERVGKSQVILPYKIGGYADIPGLTNSAKTLILNALAGTEGKPVLPSGRIQDISKVVPTLSNMTFTGTAKSAKLSLTFGGTSTAITNMAVKVSTAVSAAQYAQEAKAVVGTGIRISPYTDCGTTTMTAIAQIKTAIGAKLADTKNKDFDKFGKLLDVSAATVTLTHKSGNLYDAKVYKSANSGTFVNIENFAVSVEPPVDSRLVPLAKAEFATTLEIPFRAAGYADEDAKAAAASVEAKNLLADPVKQKKQMLPVTLSGVEAKVVWDKQASTYELVLTKGIVTSRSPINVVVKANNEAVVAAAKALIGASVEIKHKAYPGYFTDAGVELTSTKITQANAVLKEMLDATASDPLPLNGVSATVKYASSKYQLVLAQGGFTDTSVKDFGITVAKGTDRELMASAESLITNTIIIPFKPEGYGTGDAAGTAKAAAAVAAVRKILDATAGKEVDLSGITAAVEYKNTNGSFVLSLLKGTEVGTTPRTVKLADGAKPIDAAKTNLGTGIQIDFNAAAADDPVMKASLATAAANKKLQDANIVGATATVKWNPTYVQFDLKLTQGDASKAENVIDVLDFKVDMKPDPDIATVGAAKTLLGATVEIPFASPDYADQAAKAAEATAVVTKKLADTAAKAKKPEDDLSGVKAKITWNAATSKYELVLTKGLQTDKSVTDFKITIGADPSFDLVREALLVIGTSVKIPYVNAPGYPDNTARAEAATLALQKLLDETADNATDLSDVTATVIWNGTAGNYELVVEKGAAKNDAIKNFGVSEDVDPNLDLVADAVAFINGSVEVPYAKYANENAKAAAATDAVNALLEETAGNEPEEDFSGIVATVTWDAKAAKFSLNMVIGDVDDDFAIAITIADAPAPSSANIDVKLAAGSSWVDGVRGWLVEGGTIELTLYTDIEDVTIEWHRVNWSDGGADTILTGTGVTITDAPGAGVYDYYVLVSNKSGAVYSPLFDVQIVVPENPTLNSVTPASPFTADPDEEIVVTLDADGSGLIYCWFFVDWANDIVTVLENETSSSITVNAPTTPGVYSFFASIVSDSWGVVWTDFITVTVE